MVFCTLSKQQLHLTMMVATSMGLKWELFNWYKPDLAGKSHEGGARAAKCLEPIVVVYGFAEDQTTNGLDQHYALLYQKKNPLEVIVF